MGTVPASLWPHQEAFFQQHAKNDDTPVRKLIADEVGLGKTLQAASLLKWRINQGKASRFLILTPAGSRFQWQNELHDRLNISVPVMERRQNRVMLIHPDGREEFAPFDHWAQSHAIVSYHWARRNADELLQIARQASYDFIIIDEAHHARYSEPEHPKRRNKNQYLKLLTNLSECTRDLLLLTATPMQMAAIDLWALLNLLDRETWALPDFERLYDPQLAKTRTSWHLARQAYQRYVPRPHELSGDEAERIVWSDSDAWVNSRLNTQTMRDTVNYMRRNGPVASLMSRHTRTLLREYQKQGYDTAVPDRYVQRRKHHNERPRARTIRRHKAPRRVHLRKPPRRQPAGARLHHDSIPHSHGLIASRVRMQPAKSSQQALSAKRFPTGDRRLRVGGARRTNRRRYRSITQKMTTTRIPRTARSPVSLDARQVYELERNIQKAQELSETDSKLATLIATARRPAIQRASSHHHLHSVS